MSLSHLTLYIYELLYVDIMELIMISRDCIDDIVLRVIDNTSKLELGDRIRESLYSTHGYTPHALKKREWINVHKKESMINRLPTPYFAIALDKDFIKNYKLNKQDLFTVYTNDKSYLIRRTEGYVSPECTFNPRAFKCDKR
jgi:hypothetical protein